MSEENDTPPGGGEQAPVVDAGTIQEVAPGVHIIPDGRVPLVPNIGIVLGEESALVIDTGMGPGNGRTALDAVRRVAGDRKLFLTITHFHPEHGFGAQAFRDEATILYNRQQREDLLRKGPGYLDLFQTFGTHVAEQLEGVDFVDPHVCYSSAAELDLGDRTVELQAVGQAHTLGDQIIHVPDERVLFAGDLIETRIFAIFPYFPPDDVDVHGSKWIEALAGIERMEPSTIVPGHGEIGGVERATVAREYISMLRDETFSRAEQGQDLETIVADLAPSIREERADWDSPEWIDFGIQCFYDEYITTKS